MTTIELLTKTRPEADALVALHPPGAPGPDTPFAEYDEALDGRLGTLLAEERFTGKLNQQLQVHTLGRLPFGRLLLLGTGAADALDAAGWIAIGERIGSAASKGRWRTVAVVGLGDEPNLEKLALGVQLGGYRFDRYQTADEDDGERVSLDKLLLVHRGEAPDQTALDRTALLAEAVCFARDLVNEPAEVSTPTRLAAAAEEIAAAHGLTCEVLDEAQCDALGMGLFLAVARGSAEPPRFIHLTYEPADAPPDAPVVALVGKGITFDAGGLSLKPTSSMKDMKSDMAGGAAVLAATKLLAPFEVPVVVHAFVPACENMPSGRAYRLGDVIRGMDGPSVEVVNTDAEGRLALADAISYARWKGCTRIVDLATLTGACVVALGPDIAGVMGPDDALARSLIDAAERAGEQTWQLPLPSALDEQLKSPVADCKNSGGRWGGALTAGLFLKKFAKDTEWVHVDLAGPAFAEKGKPGRPSGGTGFGVATLLELLLAQTEESS